jgi:hypothetical protein
MEDVKYCSIVMMSAIETHRAQPFEILKKKIK